MILIVTNRQDQTVDYLIVELKRRGVDYLRFNTEDYPRHVKVAWEFDGHGFHGYFTFPKRKLLFEEITSVWYRRPVSPIPAPEVTDEEDRIFIIEESRTALEGILRTLDCFWVSNPDALRIAENKLHQLRVAKQVGFTIYPTIITNDPKTAEEFYQKYSADIVYKPLRHGRLTREHHTGLIFTNRVKPEHLAWFSQVSLAPSQFQKYVKKQLELRITVIGTKVFAVEIHSQEIPETKDDWRKVRSESLRHHRHKLPEEIETKCKELLQELHLAFGAIDMVLTPDGTYVFLEINPNGQWAWIQQLLPDIPLRESLADLLIMGRALS